MTKDNYGVIADHINNDGRAFADWAMERALGSPDIALAILGVAAGMVIDRIEQEKRSEVLRNYLDSFDDSAHQREVKNRI